MLIEVLVQAVTRPGKWPQVYHKYGCMDERAEGSYKANYRRLLSLQANFFFSRIACCLYSHLLSRKSLLFSLLYSGPTN